MDDDALLLGIIIFFCCIGNDNIPDSRIINTVGIVIGVV